MQSVPDVIAATVRFLLTHIEGFDARASAPTADHVFPRGTLTMTPQIAPLWPGQEALDQRIRAITSTVVAALAAGKPDRVEIIGQPAARFGYTNWRGEHSGREVIPIRLWYGATEWHPAPQWFLHGYDADKGEFRDFALVGLGLAAEKTAQAYQVIGHLLSETSVVEAGEGRRVLDYFADASSFDPDFLPWPHEHTAPPPDAAFEEWWSKEGAYIDPDTSDVPWFDKRKGLAMAAYFAAARTHPSPSTEGLGVRVKDPTYRSPREDAAYFGSIWSLSTNQMAELERTFEYHRDHHPSFGTDYPEGVLSSVEHNTMARSAEQVTLHPLADREMSADLSALSASAEQVEITDEMVAEILAWVREDVLPAYGIANPVDPEIAEGARAAITAALSKGGAE